MAISFKQNQGFIFEIWRWNKDPDTKDKTKAHVFDNTIYRSFILVAKHTLYDFAPVVTLIIM